MNTLNNIIATVESSFKFDQYLSNELPAEANNELSIMKKLTSSFITDLSLNNRMKLAIELTKKLYSINVELGRYFASANSQLKFSSSPINHSLDIVLCFYDPYCKFSRNFCHIWNKLVEESRGRHNYVAVDCTSPKNTAKCSKYISGFPSVHYMTQTNVISYEGDLTYDDVKKFIYKL